MIIEKLIESIASKFHLELNRVDNEIVGYLHLGLNKWFVLSSKSYQGVHHEIHVNAHWNKGVFKGRTFTSSEMADPEFMNNILTWVDKRIKHIIGESTAEGLHFSQ